MPIFDALVPGRAKSNTRNAIGDLNVLAHKEAERQALPPARATLWISMCDGASLLLLQLFVDNKDKTVDWRLKGHRRKLNTTRLAAAYWWMVHFQLVLFRNRGANGYEVEDEFSELLVTARNFLDHLMSIEAYGDVDPGHWSEAWASQVPLEAALGLYNVLMNMLGLRIELEQRINRVSLFTSASERAYDSTVKTGASRRNGTNPG